MGSQTLAFMPYFLRSQLLITPPYPTQTFAGQTIIVTGSNNGLGFEAAKHFARLNASKVIIAVRSTSKGETARSTIISSVGCDPSVLEVWQLDLCSYESVQHFARRVSEQLPRLDAIVLNAAIQPTKYETAEDDEATITTNVVSTFLLALLVLPKLKQTAAKFNVRPRLAIVASEVHYFTTMEDVRHTTGSLFAALNNDKIDVTKDRYFVSKLMDIVAMRQLVAQYASDPDYPVTISALNPGWCWSGLNKEDKSYFLLLVMRLMCRSTEVGGRTLVHAAGAGPETHGQYLSDCKVEEPAPFVRSEEGRKLQERVWNELAEKLEKIQPGILKNL